MDIRHCRDCGEFRYLERDGKCRGCLPDAEPTGQSHSGSPNTSRTKSQVTQNTVKVFPDTFHHTLRIDAEMWRVIAETVNDNPHVEFSNNPQEVIGDLDLNGDCVRIYGAGIERKYLDYPGGKLDQVRQALEDVLDDAVDKYC